MRECFILHGLPVGVSIRAFLPANTEGGGTLGLTGAATVYGADGVELVGGMTSVAADGSARLYYDGQVDIRLGGSGFGADLTLNGGNPLWLPRQSGVQTTAIASKTGLANTSVGALSIPPGELSVALSYAGEVETDRKAFFSGVEKTLSDVSGYSADFTGGQPEGIYTIFAYLDEADEVALATTNLPSTIGADCIVVGRVYWSGAAASELVDLRAHESRSALDYRDTLERLEIDSPVKVQSTGNFTLKQGLHRGKLVAVTALSTITIGAASSYAEGFQCVIINLHTADLTFSGTITAEGTKLATKRMATVAKVNGVIVVSNLS